MATEKQQEITLRVGGDPDEARRIIKEAEEMGVQLRLVAGVPEDTFYKDKIARLERENNELRAEKESLTEKLQSAAARNTELSQRYIRIRDAYLDAKGL